MQPAQNEQWGEPVEWHNCYNVGINEYPGPEASKVSHMFFLVAYDICKPSRLRKVAKTCEDYGVRIEKSVFQCDLPRDRFEDLWCELIDLIDEDEDAVIAYRICQSCLREAESMGIVRTPQKRICYIL